MTKGLVISIDAMGGANAPASVVEGLELIAEKHSDVFFLVYGKRDFLDSMLSKCKKLQGKHRLIDASTVISDDESPIKAYKTGSDSSLRKAIDAVKSGEADACVSCGNTGALMVTAKMVLGSLKHVKRPAIISIFPNKKDGVVMLDLGANSECEPINFLQFAIMGSCFAKALFQNPNPSVGILNIGVEEHKGRDLEKKSAEMLRDSKLNYKGFIEGYDLSEGSIDVVVTDGFTGNIALKVAEGVANTCMHYMKLGMKSSFISKFGALLTKRGLKKSFALIDPRNYNGAMFVGLNGIVVKSHGSSDSIAFANALEVAIKLAKNDVNKRISSMIHEYHAEDQPSIVSKIKHSLGF